jgi:hypothetical protein
MVVEEIVTDWLKGHGYDGLCNSQEECGCSLNNFIPCGEIGHDCEAAYEVSAHEDAEVDFWMVPIKPGEKEKL